LIRNDYIRATKKLAGFLGRSPGIATTEDPGAFQLHLTATGNSAIHHQRTAEIPQARRHSQAVDREHRRAHEPHFVIAK
jgi:hypothetical protein